MWFTGVLIRFLKQIRLSQRELPNTEHSVENWTSQYNEDI